MSSNQPISLKQSAAQQDVSCASGSHTGRLTTSNSPRGTLMFSFYPGGIDQPTPNGNMSLSYLHKVIVYNPVLRRLIEKLRALPLESEEWEKAKKRLPYVTPAGTFTKRAAAEIKARAGLLVLDFDKVPDLGALKVVLHKDPVFSASMGSYFDSPSGLGLKVLVVVDCSVSHAASFEAIKTYLQRQHPAWFEYLDLTTKDIARACFLAHDPHAYLHPNCDFLPPFPVDSTAQVVAASATPISRTGNAEVSRYSGDAVKAEALVQAVEAAGSYPDDYDSWFKTAAALNNTCGEDVGRDLFHRLSKLSPKYNPARTDKQFTDVLKGNYTRITLGTLIHYCQEAGIALPSRSEVNVTLPLLGEHFYAQLPSFLRRACEPFKGVEREVMLRGTLGVLSGCFPGVGGVYDRRLRSLNLFVFIAGPAASGKGALTWARHLVEPWDEKLLAASEAYQDQLAAYEKAADPSQPPPTAPAYQQLLIPGNVTSAALLTCMAANRGQGIICETEADTLSAQLGNKEHGNFSDILRKAFHGEPVSVLRKTNREHLRIKHPTLAIAVTGTPDQLLRLLPSAEDGLVSRFLFLLIEPDYHWKDVSPAAGTALDPLMDTLAADLTRMLDAMPTPAVAGEYLTHITLSAADWQRLNKAWEAGLDESLAARGERGAGVAYRLGLITWRIIGILTVLRCFEQGHPPREVEEASALDVSTALSLASATRQHAMTVLGNLTQPTKFKATTHATKAEQVAKAIELRKRGISWRQMGQQLGVPFNTLRGWLTGK